MKKIIYTVAAALVAISCTYDITPGGSVKTQLQASAEMQTDISRTSLDNSLRVLWSEGDKVGVLYMSDGASVNDEFTLTEGAGQLKGKFEGTLISAEASDYYAVYPFNAEAAITSTAITVPLPSTQKYAAGSFAAGANPSVAHFTYEGRSNLSFKNLCGLFKLQLKGEPTITVASITVADKGGSKLWGTASIDLSSVDTQPSMTISGGGSEITLTDINEVLNASTAKDFYFVVPAGAFSKGFTARVTDTNGNVYTLTTDVDNTVRRSTVLSMPEVSVTTPVAAVDLSASATANCYIIDSSTEGEYCFFCGAKGNAGLNPTGSNAISVASASVLWETFNTAVAPKTNEIISSVSVRDGKIYFHHSGKVGNSIIAGKDASGNIVWSWHIWCVSTPVKALGPLPSGAYILDRSLGCLSDGAVRPFAYQWGRKDPFVVGVESVSGSAYCAVSGAAKEVQVAQAQGVEDAIKHPTTFFAQSGYYNWLNTTDDSLWGTTKTIYDPCPIGYKVHPSGTFAGLDAADFTAATNGYTVKHGGVDLGFFPSSTYIHQNGSTLSSVNAVYVWSSYAETAHATFMRFTGSAFESDRPFTNANQSNCVLGLSVRCVKE
ncbi:MAG: hypothetical protein IKX03_01355 [Bacteroidales bacterium]|nr:hypothetical protein [Bacteroidales bacterium]